MPTLSMTIDLAGALPPAARLDVVADPPAIEDGFVSTVGTVRDGGRAIGHCAATFALGSPGFAVLPWEERRDPPGRSGPRRGLVRPAG